MEENGRVNVVIADDCQFFVKFFEIMLGEAGIKVVGVAKNGQEAVDLVKQLRPEAVLLDISPKLNGIKVAKEIRDIAPRVVIFIMSSYTESVYEKAALTAGAKGYLPKGMPIEEIVEKIRLAAS